MPWRRADFKEKKIWAEVDDKGDLVIKGGRVGVRYSKRPGAKIYQGGASRVALEPDAPIETLDEGEAAPADTGRRKSRSSGFGSAGTRTAAQAAMAQDAARKLIESLSEDTVVAFTDGSCRGNPGPAGSGAALRLPGGRRVEASRSLGQGTNNVAELTAVRVALDLIERAKVAPKTKIALFTDSAYTHGVLVKGWKAKANQELIYELRDRLKRYPNLEIFWIAGHVGVEGNERADQLANDGVDGVTAVYEG